MLVNVIVFPPQKVKSGRETIKAYAEVGDNYWNLENEKTEKKKR